MWNLIQLKDQIKYRMVEILFQAKDPVTIETLALETEVSTRSIKNYLAELKTMVKEFNGSVVTSKEGIMLHFPENIGIDSIQRHLLQNAPELMLLELIFRNDQVYSIELEDQLFISSSSLNRTIRTMKDALKEYGLSIEANPYRITGDEMQIRRFYSAYFLETYSITEWPFEEISLEHVNDMLDILLQEKDTLTELMDYHKFRIRFSLDIIRIRKGYSVEDLFLHQSSIEASYHKITEELTREIETKGYSIEETDLYARELALWYIYFSHGTFTHCRISDHEYSQRIASFEKIIQELSSLFSLPSFDCSGILMDLNRSLGLYSQNMIRKISKEYVLFRPRDYFLLNIYKTSFPFFYDAAESKLLAFCLEWEIQVDPHGLEHLMHILLSKWEDLTLILFERYNTCRVLVYSHLHYRHAENIVSSLYAYINRSMQIEIYHETSISEEALKKYNFDVLVATTTLSLRIPQKVQYLHYKIHGPFVQPLVKIIDEVIKVNKKKVHEDILSLL